MKQSGKSRIVALVSVFALICSVVCVTAFAAPDSGKAENDAALKAEESTPVESASPAQSAEPVRKEETVYVIAGADGDVKKIIVSDELKNTIAGSAVEDVSELEDIEDVKGDAAYTGEGSTKIWDAQGNGVYYQGSIEKELPVKLSVSYTLDGKRVTPSELSGKSGRVTIRFDYENRQYETVEINGVQEKIYVPFVTLTGMLLDSDSFSNITVSNGKLIEDGSHTAVVGFAFPGLQNNLAVDKDTLDMPEYVEISADVKNFELTNTITVATNSIFNDMEDDAFKSADIDSLSGSLDQLSSAMYRLMDGSSELYNGLSTLLIKSGDLVNGVDQLANGLNELAANSSALNAGAKQVFDSLLDIANSQLAASGVDAPQLTIDNYSEVISGVLSQVTGGTITVHPDGSISRDQIEQLVRAQEPAIRAAVTQAVSQEVTAQVTETVLNSVWPQVLASVGLTEEDYAAAIANGAITEEQQAQLSAALEQQMAGETVQATISAAVAEQMASENVAAIINTKTEEKIQELVEQYMAAAASAISQISVTVPTENTGLSALLSLKKQLDSYYAFYSGLTSYTSGVQAARDGAAAIQGSMPALTDGITQLADGAMQLSDGLTQFNEEGIQRLINAFDGNLDGLADRLQATLDVSRSYNTFSGLSDTMDGSVKFIYRTEAIEEQDD